jgi:hypothetical protein
MDIHFSSTFRALYEVIILSICHFHADDGNEQSSPRCKYNRFIYPNMYNRFIYPNMYNRFIYPMQYNRFMCPMFIIVQSFY